MKNTIKLFVIIVFTVMIGFSLAACGGEGGGGDGGTGGTSGGGGTGGTGGTGSTSGTGGTGSGGILTVTGIPSTYNGKYALFVGYVNNNAKIIYGYHLRFGTHPQISNGSVSISLCELNSSGISGYYGSDTGLGRFEIHDSASPTSDDEDLASRYWSSITFKNGSATITWNNGVDGSLW